MTANELHEHLRYWRDEAKVAAYSAALAEVVKPGDKVLDLGSGTGLLGLLALQAGAGEVWSIDSGEILGLARDIVRANGFEGRVHFVKGMTTEIELPRVDVVVCDQIGGLVYDAGILEFFADAQARSLGPEGTLVPASFELFVAPVEASGPYDEVDGWSAHAGFDLAAARVYAANTVHRIAPDEIERLAPGGSIATIGSADASPIRAEHHWVAERDGVLHGLAGWFEAQLSPSVNLTNEPGAEGRMKRWLNFYPVTEPVQIKAGERVDASIDIRPPAQMATWSVGVAGGSTQRMSTFNGSFAFEPHRSDAVTKAAVERSDRRSVLIELATLAEDGASFATLRAAAETHTDTFPTPDAAARFARHVHRLLN